MLSIFWSCGDLFGKKGGKNTFENNLPEKAAGKSRDDGTYKFNKPATLLNVYYSSEYINLFLKNKKKGLTQNQN